MLYKPGHDNAQRQGYVPEHVYIMSVAMGRPLFSNETVHHINGVKADNRLDNLELWASNHPPGQRVHQLVDWAEKLLRTYAPEKLR